MPTIAQRFYETTTADDQTFSGEATIRKLAEAAGSGTGTVTWTTTTAAEKTVIPGTGSTATGDTSNNNGWAINNGGADGMGATPTQNRTIPAGVWEFSAALAVNTPALLASIPNSTITAKVYRVPSGGGARQLLFTAVSAGFTASGTRAWSSASQPAYTLDAGETIMVGFTMNSAATAATLFGAITNTVWTMTYGANTWFEVPAPGIRSMYFQNPTASITPGVGEKLIKAIRTLNSGINAASGIILKTIRTFDSGITAGDGIVFKRPSRRFDSSNVPGPGILSRRPIRIFASTQTPGPNTIQKSLSMSWEGTVTPTAQVSRGLFMFLAGLVTPGPNTLPRRIFSFYEGTSISSAVMFKQWQHVFTGLQAPGPSSLSRRLFAILEGVIAPAAVRVKLIIYSFEASIIGSAGVVTKRYQPLPYASSITPGPSALPRRPGKLAQSAITSSATVGALLRKNFLAMLTSSSTLNRHLSTHYASTVTSSGAPKNRLSKLFRGLIGPTEDYPLTIPNKQIAGIVKDQSGNPVEGAIVKLFRVADDAYIVQTVSDVNGEYSFVRDQNDPNAYFVVAYEEVGTPTQGVTIRNLLPVTIP